MLRQYNRQVITLRQERTGYGIKGKEPFGRCTIEVRENNLKILLNLQNLKTNNYKAYLVSVKDTKSTAVFVGNVKAEESGKCEAKFVSDSDNVGKSGMSIEEFNTIIIMEPNEKEMLVPLVGYSNEVLRWKNNFTFYKHGEENELRTEQPPVKINEQEIDSSEEEVKEKVKKETEVIQEHTDIQDVILQAEDEERIVVGNEDLINLNYDNEAEQKKITAEWNSDQEQLLSGGSKLEQQQKGESGTNIEQADEFKYYKIDNYYNNESQREIEAKDNVNAQNEHLHNLNPKTAAAPLTYEEMLELNKEQVHNHYIKPEKEVSDIDDILQNNIKLHPFKRQNKEVHWVRISLEELVYLCINKWEYLNSPLILSAYKKNKHLIFGKIDGSSNEYYLGIPEQYRAEDKQIANNLGFKQFKCCDDVEEAEGEYGYWLMKIVY